MASYPPPRPTTGDLTTIIGIRGFVTGRVGFRRPASEFPDFDDILRASYEVFENDPLEYRLHLHYQQGGLCSREELLERAEWNRGEYFIGGSIEFFAHFMAKGSGPPRGGRSVSAVTPQPMFMGRPGSMAPPPLPASTRPQGYHPSQSASLMPYPPRGPPNYGPRRAPSQGVSVSTSAGQQSAPQRSRRGLNEDSTTVYSLSMPMPAEHYGKKQYFSGPYVFIPYPTQAPRWVSITYPKLFDYCLTLPSANTSTQNRPTISWLPFPRGNHAYTRTTAIKSLPVETVIL